jgi:hypothetical protein
MRIRFKATPPCLPLPNSQPDTFYRGLVLGGHVKANDASKPDLSLLASSFSEETPATIDLNYRLGIWPDSRVDEKYSAGHSICETDFYPLPLSDFPRRTNFPEYLYKLPEADRDEMLFMLRHAGRMIFGRETHQRHVR